MQSFPIILMKYITILPLAFKGSVLKRVRKGQKNSLKPPQSEIKLAKNNPGTNVKLSLKRELTQFNRYKKTQNTLYNRIVRRFLSY